MKDLEKLFKESLQNHEMPYDANAWNSLSQKMTTPKKPFYKKGWFYGAVAAVAVGTVGGIVISNNSEVSPKEEISVVETKDETLTTQENIKDNNEETVIVNSKELEDVSDSKEDIESPEQHVKVIHKKDVTHKEQPEIFTPNPTLLETTEGKRPDKEVVINTNFGLSTVSACEGDLVTVFLPVQNGEFTESVKVNGKKVPLDSRSFDVVALGNPMEIEYTVQGESSAMNVDVKPMETLDIQYSTYTEDGMPLTHFTTTIEKPIWKIDGKVVSDKKEFKHLFIHKGRYEVSVESSSKEVCADIYTEAVQIEENYRLFAETGMSMSSTDSRLNSFMPFALKEMDNPNFFLTVMDAKTGQQLYTTNNANEPWDGTNPATGNKMEPGSIIFWTVIIKDNPYIKEPIKGDITIAK